MRFSEAVLKLEELEKKVMEAARALREADQELKVFTKETWGISDGEQAQLTSTLKMIGKVAEMVVEERVK